MDTPYVEDGLASVTSTDGTLRVERVTHLVDEDFTESVFAESMKMDVGDTLKVSIPLKST